MGFVSSIFAFAFVSAMTGSCVGFGAAEAAEAGEGEGEGYGYAVLEIQTTSPT